MFEVVLAENVPPTILRGVKDEATFSLSLFRSSGKYFGGVFFDASRLDQANGQRGVGGPTGRQCLWGFSTNSSRTSTHLTKSPLPLPLPRL
jgi:hypothetical protein